MTRRSVFAWGSLALIGRLLRAQTIHLMPNTESEIALEVNKTGLMAGKKHHLVFSRYQGTASQGTSPQVTFTVQADSFVCQDDWVKPKDKEKITRYAIDDLLEAHRYPTLRYKSTAVHSNGSSYRIDGNLTIKNETRPVAVTVARKVSDRIVWTGEATIRLTDFNLKPPTAALGAIGTEDATHLVFHLTSNNSA